MKPIDLIGGVPAWEGNPILPGTVIRLQVTREVPAAPRRRNFGYVSTPGTFDRNTPQGRALLKGMWDAECPPDKDAHPEQCVALVPEGGIPIKVISPALLASTMGDAPKAPPPGTKVHPAGPPSIVQEIVTGSVLADSIDPSRRYIEAPQGAGRIYLQAGMMAEYVTLTGFEKTVGQLLRGGKINKAGYGPVDVLDTNTGAQYLGVKLVLVNPTTVNIVEPGGAVHRMNPGWRLRDTGATKGAVAPAPAPTPAAPASAPAPAAPVSAPVPAPVPAAPAPRVDDPPPPHVNPLPPSTAESDRLRTLENAFIDMQKAVNASAKRLDQLMMLLLSDEPPAPTPAASPTPTPAPAPPVTETEDAGIPLGDDGSGIE